MIFDDTVCSRGSREMDVWCGEIMLQDLLGVCDGRYTDAAPRFRNLCE